MPNLRCQRFTLCRLLLISLAFSSSLAAEPVTRLKVLTFNIWRQGGLSLSNCIEVIRSSGADVVGLQECNESTARTIAATLGFNVLPAGDCSIVTRYPIVATNLAGAACGLTVQLATNQRAHLFNCHPPAYPYGPYDLKDGRAVADVTNQETTVRMPAVNQVLGALRPFLSGSDPCFLTGDFNAPSHLDYAEVAWPTSVACVQAGLRDSYRELHATNRTYPGAFAYNDPGITWTPKLSEEAKGVFDRIDFVYYAPRDSVAALASEELDERNSVSPWPSDHRAVLTTFALTPPTPAGQATFPTPADLATNLASSLYLFWLPASNATLHAVYVGTQGQMNLVTNTSATSVRVSNLAPGTTFFWRVDETTPTGVVPGNVWSFTTRAAAVYEWNFSNGTLAPSIGQGIFAYADGVVSSNLTSWGMTDGTLVPHINGIPASYLRVPAFSGISNGYFLTFPDSPPNGGGQYLNQYTLILDVLLPPPLSWCALFNTSTANANDAELYIGSDGSLGIGPIGYSAAGTVQSNTWQRIAVAADLAAGTVIYYVNGAPVRAGSASLDGRFSMYSNMDAGPDLLLFNEGDTSGVYTHVVYLNSLCFTDRTMTPAEIQALGGPKARGILAAAPAVRLSIRPDSGHLVLTWTNGSGPFQLQRTRSISPAPSWENVGTASLATNATVPVESTNAFFRVVDQGL